MLVDPSYRFGAMYVPFSLAFSVIIHRIREHKPPPKRNSRYHRSFSTCPEFFAITQTTPQPTLTIDIRQRGREYEEHMHCLSLFGAAD